MAAARPEELVDAALPEPVFEGVPLGVLDESDEVVLMLFSLVSTAVRPVTLVQLELTLELTPWTKLTGAHWPISSHVSNSMRENYLVENTVWALLDDLDQTTLAGEFRGSLERRQAELTQAGF